MAITYGDHLIDSGFHDITQEQERAMEQIDYNEPIDDAGHVVGDGIKAELAEARDAIRTQNEVILSGTEKLAEALAQVERLRAALKWISDMCPATADMSIAHMMADAADAALEDNS
jgi:2-keto-3-deoxy-galactonokinase